MNVPECFESRVLSISVKQLRGDAHYQWVTRATTTLQVLQSDYNILAWMVMQMDRELLASFGWVSADREWTVRMDVLS